MQGLSVGTPSPISAVPVSILVGMALSGAFGLGAHPMLKPGLGFCSTTVLRVGIVCVGAKLSMLDLVQVMMAAQGTAMSDLEIIFIFFCHIS
jgi:uncharacterized membrane protein YadS